MPKPVITSHQVSITEWLAAIGEVEESNAFRIEDNKKAGRLETLFQAIGLPYERPEEFPARELADLGPRFREVLETRGHELCAIRLVPNKPDLPKLRQRGISIRDCYENWFKKQEIDPDAYSAFICPHSETLLWSATFVVTDQAVYGEIIRGLHSQLTHGETSDDLLQFAWDFEAWSWSSHDAEAEREIKRLVDLLRVEDEPTRRDLAASLDADFSDVYLKGYFEATVWPDGKAYIIDYNRLLPGYLPVSVAVVPRTSEILDSLAGAVAHPGFATGRVRLVTDISAIPDFAEGDILVCDNTDVRFLPLMRKSAAIVTDRGGILTHAAIVARELCKPCVIGTKNATSVLNDGDEVEVDATRGIVRRLKKAD